jgi:transcriptional regulator with XRE-family HTH domain
MARKLKPRLTKTDPDFSDAVVRALVKYRDSRRLKDAQIADLLGVSKPTLSKYLSQAIQIGGAVLARAFVELNIEVNYQRQSDFRDGLPAPNASTGVRTSTDGIRVQSTLFTKRNKRRFGSHDRKEESDL